MFNIYEHSLKVSHCWAIYTVYGTYIQSGFFSKNNLSPLLSPTWYLIFSLFLTQILLSVLAVCVATTAAVVARAEEDLDQESVAAQGSR